MRLRSRSGMAVWLAAGVVFGARAAGATNPRLSLSPAVLLSGWPLLALMCALAFFNWRKKLSMVPVGRASLWLGMHVVGGFLAIGIFFLHTGTVWPTGAYEQVLAALFYLTSIS